MKKQIGYISLDYMPVGTHYSEWSVEIDGVTTDLKIVRAHDVEGWYEYQTRHKIKVKWCDDVIEYNSTTHEKGNVTIRYTGTNPSYNDYK